MKTKLFIALITALSLVVSKADIIVPLTVSITADAQVQNASTVNGTNVTVLSPVKYSITTASLLKMIGDAEGTTFLPGSTIVFIDDTGNFPASRFVVMFAGGIVCECSDVLTFSKDADFVQFGKYSNPDFLSNPMTQDFVSRITFDNTGKGGNVRFYLAGLMAAVTTDKPTFKGSIFWNETTKCTMKNAVGSGIVNGSGAYFTGGFTMSGTGQFNF